ENVARIFSVASPFFSGMGIALKPEGGPMVLFQSIGKYAQLGGGLPGFQFMFPIPRSIFQTQDNQFTLEVTGPELSTLNQIASDLKGKLEASDFVSKLGYGAVQSSYEEGVPELQVSIDPHRARQLGLFLPDVA